MANVFSPYAALQLAARTDLSQAPNLKQSGGKVFEVDIPITAYTAVAANPLFLFRLPAGAKLLTQKCSVDYGAPASTALTGKIGYYTAATDTPAAVDDACFGTALALGTSAGRKAFTDAGTLGTALLTPFQFTADSWVVVTWTTVTAALSHSQTWHLTYTLA